MLVPKIKEYHAHSMSWDQTVIKSNWSSSNFEELEQMIEDIKSDSNLLFGMQSHDWHHYSVSYIIIIAICVIVYVFLKKINVLVQHIGQNALAKISMPAIDVTEMNESDEQENIV